MLTKQRGCIDFIEEHLKVLIPYLLNTLNDPKVRCAIHGRDPFLTFTFCSPLFARSPVGR